MTEAVWRYYNVVNWPRVVNSTLTVIAGAATRDLPKLSCYHYQDKDVDAAIIIDVSHDASTYFTQWASRYHQIEVY